MTKISIRTLIVDDMSLVKERIKCLLANHPEIVVTGEYTDGRKASAAIKRLSPDLVFLDIQMPVMDGFQVIENIGLDNLPNIIFLTDYDQFALHALDLHAVEYLLKPIAPEQMQRAIKQIKKQTDRSSKENFKRQFSSLLKTVDGYKKNKKSLKRLVVKAEDHTVVVQMDEIDWIQSQGNFTQLFVGKDSHLICERIGALEQKLDSKKFVRIHRSIIVNIDRVKELHPLFNNDQLVVLQNGKRLNMSRTYTKKLLKLLGE